MSPSSQRAWIEIYDTPKYRYVINVALLAEGVDRNIMDTIIDNTSVSRPPRRGRG